MIINRKAVIAAIILSVCVTAVQILDAQLLHPSNLDFEIGTVNEMPRSWILPAYASSREYNAYMTDFKPKTGKYCLELNRFAPYKDSLYGSVMQSIDAKPYRGKSVKFGAWVRAEIHGPQGSAHLWLIEYNKEKDINVYDLMEDRPIVSNEWDYYQIIVDIPDNADFINFGLMLKGNGKAWIDGAEFVIADTAEFRYTLPKKLSNREVHNLFVFAKLFGYAQFYNPSTEATNIDFDKFLLTALPDVEKARNDNELKDILNKLFNFIFPALKIYDKMLPPETYYFTAQPEDAVNDAAFAKLHIGSPTMPQNNITYSRTVNVFNSLYSSEGAVVQLLNATNLKGKEITLSIYAKADVVQPNGRAEIRIGAEDKNETRTYILQHIKFVRIKDNKWKLYKIKLNVPEDAFAVRIGLVLSGDGMVRFDEAKLTIKGNNSGIEDFRNGDFEIEKTQRIAHGWRLVMSAEKAGYSAAIIKNDIYHGNQALEISSPEDNRIPLPAPGELLLGDLSDSIGFSLPYCLYVDQNRTLPHAKEKSPLFENAGFVPGGKDRYSRMATVIHSWVLFKHFNLFNNNAESWDKIFPTIIKRAALDKNNHEFINTLNLLVANLNDSYARVWLAGENFYYGLPFLIRWRDSVLVVTKVSETFDSVEVGDIILSINGMPAKQYLDEASRFISAANRDRKYLRAIAELRAGLANSQVRMSFLSANGNNKTLTIKRSIYLSELNEDRPAFASELEKDIFYIDLTRINDKLFFELLDSLRNAKGIIFDLRGTTAISEHILSFFITNPIPSIKWEIPVYTKPSFEPVSYKTIQGQIKARSSLNKADVVFLADERTLGYAEAILQLAKANNIGEIVGGRTAGTAGYISSFSIGTSYGFSWTSVKATDDKGNDIYGGIEPTITLEQLRISDKPILKLAYELIK